MPIEKLTAEGIESRLESLPEWSLSGDTLQRTLGFEDFVATMRAVNRIAEIAEAQQHHPDMLIRYNKLTLSLSTHDAGGITEKDFRLANAIESALAPKD